VNVRERFDAIRARIVLPAIAAPMFLVSGPELVIACCQAGMPASFPTLNARPDATTTQRTCPECVRGGHPLSRA